MSTTQEIRPGIQFHANPHNIDILRLHYSADPEKSAGEKIYVEELDMYLSPWAANAYRSMTNPSLYQQEYEIDAPATLGQLLYHMDEAVTVCNSFPIPPTWTRRMGLDPHPGIPHAFLWCATDRYGDRWYYRELWPSKVCFRYERGMLRGAPGPCPADDNRIRISEYVETLKWLESSDNPENCHEGRPFHERIFERVIDYAARAFGKGTNDDPEQENFQQRYEKYLQLPPETSCSTFKDAKKDHDSGQEAVAEGLKVIQTMGNDGEFRKTSRIHIFGDRCPELVWQLKNNRRQQLTPTQIEKQDPTGAPVKVRNHQTDLIRYLEMSNPVYMPEFTHASDFDPTYEGTSY